MKKKQREILSDVLLIILILIFLFIGFNVLYHYAFPVIAKEDVIEEISNKQEVRKELSKQFQELAKTYAEKDPDLCEILLILSFVFDYSDHESLLISYLHSFLDKISGAVEEKPSKAPSFNMNQSTDREV